MDHGETRIRRSIYRPCWIKNFSSYRTWNYSTKLHWRWSLVPSPLTGMHCDVMQLTIQTPAPVCPHQIKVPIHNKSFQYILAWYILLQRAFQVFTSNWEHAKKQRKAAFIIEYMPRSQQLPNLIPLTIVNPTLLNLQRFFLLLSRTSWIHVHWPQISVKCAVCMGHRRSCISASGL